MLFSLLDTNIAPNSGWRRRVYPKCPAGSSAHLQMTMSGVTGKGGKAAFFFFFFNFTQTYTQKVIPLPHPPGSQGCQSGQKRERRRVLWLL